MAITSRGLLAAQVQAEVDTAIAKVMTNTTNKITDARGLNLDDLDAPISGIHSPLNYPVFKWSVAESDVNYAAASGTWERSADGDYYENMRIYNTSNAQTDAICIGHVFIPESADYTFYQIGRTQSSGGIGHILLANVDKGQLDWYGGVAVNVLKSVSLGTLSVGFYPVVIDIVDKNGSSGGYAMHITGAIIVKT